MPNSAISKAMERLRNTLLRRDGVGLSDGQLLERTSKRAKKRPSNPCAAPRADGLGRLPAYRRLHGGRGRCVSSHLPGSGAQGGVGRAAPRGRQLALRRRLSHLPQGKSSGREAARKVKPIHAMPEPLAGQDNHWDELLPLLDHELSRLPDKYRLPVVLCELEGRNRKDVAAQLDIPEGTLSSRLATARKMLAKRLSSRSVAVSGTMLAGLFTEAASAGVPAAWQLRRSVPRSCLRRDTERCCRSRWSVLQKEW